MFVQYLIDWISNLIKSMCLHHYNIKPTVQKAARTQEDQVTDGYDDGENEKKCILRDGVTCVTARAPPKYKSL